MGSDTSRYPFSPTYDPRRRGTHGFGEETPAPPAPPPPPDQTLSRWWQGIITLCVGLASVGLVVWFFASSFFITKEIFNEDRRLRDNVQSGTTEQLIQIGKTLAELNKTTSEISAQIHVIQIDLAVIKAAPRRNR